MARGGVSGLALTAVAGGIVVLWSGLHNVSIADTLRGFIQGNPPAGTPAQTPLSKALAEASTAAQHITLSPSITNPGLTGAAGAALGAAARAAQGGIVDDARKYLGVPYRFGQSSAQGMDCSGLVNQVVGRDLGLPIPGSASGQYSGHGPVTGQWYVWSGCTTVSKDQAAPGDLVCWTSHIGIYLGDGQMINAPSAGRTVEIDKVWGAPAPLYRRLKVT